MGRPRKPVADERIERRREQYRRAKARAYESVRGTRLGHEYQRLLAERAWLIGEGVDPAELLLPDPASLGRGLRRE